MSGSIDFAEFLKVIENQKERAENFDDESDMIGTSSIYEYVVYYALTYEERYFILMFTRLLACYVWMKYD